MKVLLLISVIFLLGAGDAGNPGDVLTTQGEGTISWEPPSEFIPGSEMFFWIGPTASVADNTDIPFFTTTPTRTNESLGSSADIVLRISDTVMRVVNTGVHNVSFSWESSGSSDEFEVKINGVVWFINHVGIISGSFNYAFTAGDDVTVTRMGGGSRTMSDITMSISRLSE